MKVLLAIALVLTGTFGTSPAEAGRLKSIVNGLCVARPTDSQLSAGDPIKMAPCSGPLTNVTYLASSKRLTFTNTGYCFRAKNNGNQVDLWPCNTTAAQRVALIPILRTAFLTVRSLVGSQPLLTAGPTVYLSNGGGNATRWQVVP